MELLFWPSDAPNVNLIERPWRLVHKRSLNSSSQGSIEQFQAAMSGVPLPLGAQRITNPLAIPNTIPQRLRHFPTEIYRLVCGNHVDTAQVAKRAGVKTLVLTHMLEQIDQPGVRERIVSEIRKVYDGNIIWGEDLMEIPIRGPQMFRME